VNQNTKKVVIVLGPTGGGKSTFFKLLRHYPNCPNLKSILSKISGNKTNVEVNGDSQSQTKTSSFDEYEFQSGDKSYMLLGLDTPGLGDTSGKQTDIDNVADLFHTLSSSTEPITSIHAVLIIWGGSSPRLTDYTVYVQKMLDG